MNFMPRILPFPGNVLGIAALTLIAPLQVRPNDDFSDATLLSGLYGQAYGNTIGATKEAGEPEVYGARRGGSVWFKYVVPSTRAYRLDMSLEVLNQGTYVYEHALDIFNVVGSDSIYNLVYAGGIVVYGGDVRTVTGFATPGEIVYFRAAPLGTGDPSPVSFTLNASPIYRTGVVFRTGGRLGRRQTVRAKLTNPKDAGRIRVVGSGKAKVSKVRYNRKSGSIKFTHIRKGRLAKKGKTRVRYTIVAYRGGTRTGIGTKKFVTR